MNEQRKSLLEKITRGIFKRSASPRADENNGDTDWQAGYFLGSLTENTAEIWEESNDITVEWNRRGSPSRTDTPEGIKFSNWKAGYHAAKLKRAMA